MTEFTTEQEKQLYEDLKELVKLTNEISMVWDDYGDVKAAQKKTAQLKAKYNFE